MSAQGFFLKPNSIEASAQYHPEDRGVLAGVPFTLPTCRLISMDVFNDLFGADKILIKKHRHTSAGISQYYHLGSTCDVSVCAHRIHIHLRQQQIIL
jgi:hypothetical protein